MEPIADKPRINTNEKLRLVLSALAAGVVVSCAVLSSGASTDPKLRLRPPLLIDRDDRDIPEPKVQRVSEIYAIVYNSWLRHLSPEYKALVARRQPALNVNAWDEVPDSTWFTNRIGRRSISFAEIVGSLEGAGPAPGRWRIHRVNNEGYTPKLDIDDPSGRRHVLKFDLPASLERNSGAERICTLIMHAAGYNVPSNNITYFRSDMLFLDDRSYYDDPVGKRRRLTQTELDESLKKLQPLPDGRYRGLASLYLPPKPLGKFVYAGRRQGDPNDLIPHELRRELRGMRVIASWINHVDAGDKNTYDAFVASADGRRFVKHYLLDFGSAMGSGDFINGPLRVGHEYIFDGPAIGRAFLTLGKWRRPWEVQGKIIYPELGYYQADLFEPQHWKPNYPNLAFERMDESDAYWGAKVVTAFSDQTIRQLAEAGQYSRPEVTRHVEEVLKRRRDAIGQYWLDRITPLEEIVLDRSAGSDRLRLRDLALERGYADPSTRAYRFWSEGLQGRKLTDPLSSKMDNRGLELGNLPVPNVTVRKGAPDRYGRTPLLRILVQSKRRDGDWALPVEVIAGYASGQPGVQILGWAHGVR